MNALSFTCSIAVLAGGMSRRMGEDKALIRLAPDDEPLLGVVINRLENLTDDLFILAPERPGYGKFGVPVVPDLYPDSGPLGGIATALLRARHDRCLVVSCDHPFLSASLLGYMSNAEGLWDALIPRSTAQSRQGSMTVLHTTHAVYRKICLPAIDRAISNGYLRSTAFLPEVTVAHLVESDIQTFDPSLRTLFSVNSMDDLAIARAWRAEEIGNQLDFVDSNM